MGCGVSKPPQRELGVVPSPAPLKKRQSQDATLAVRALTENVEKQDALFCAVEELARDICDLSTCGDAFMTKLTQVLQRRQAPMLLLPFEELRSRKTLPRFDEMAELLVPVSELKLEDEKVFISHRWFLPDEAQPDGDAGEKVQIIVQTIEQHIASPVEAAGGRVYVWVDYFSITQTAVHALHAASKGQQILAIPLYLAACDSLIALRGGDKMAYLHSAGDLTHKGFYDNRVWTVLELFGFLVQVL